MSSSRWYRFPFFVMLCLLWNIAWSQTSAATVHPPPPLGELIDVGGYRVHLYCTGKGSPTVVIVGASLSFNWGLVQPEVAKVTRVCTFDHSGAGWSDDGPQDSCSLRIFELHTALREAGIAGPLVLVGHSVGALVARLYAARYPEDASGIVFADHAFIIGKRTSGNGSMSAEDAHSTSPLEPSDQPPPRITVRTLGIEADPNFSRLPASYRELQIWAMSQPRYQAALQSAGAILPGCIADLGRASDGQNHPLGKRPLVNVSTDSHGGPDYVALQNDLTSLSTNSKALIAQNSGHFVMIDRPDVVVEAIDEVVQSVRNGAKLVSTGSER